MATVSTDVVVIGLGPGGEDVAGRLAEAGLHVTGIEKELVGGECPYWGCVPSKMMIRGADLLAEARRIPGFAGSSSVTPDWAPIARRIRKEATDTWDDKVAVDRFTGKGGHFVRGEARLVAPGRVAVGDTTFEASRGVVIATGVSPVVPPIPGLDRVRFWTNREAVKTEQVPGSLLVLGGGAVGAELAQVFSRFGAKVTVIEGAARLLPMEEPEAGALLAQVFGREGIEAVVGARAIAAEQAGQAIRVELEDGRTLEGERLLVATGRRPNLARLGLDGIGLDPRAKAIAVDSRMRAGERLWAVGDVTGHGQFTHMAIYQAGIAVPDILGMAGDEADYRTSPRVTFTDPEVGSAGITEEQAREQGLRIRVGTQQIPSNARGWIHGPGNDGFIKVIEDQAQEVLVGATSVGPRGGEVLSVLALAVHARIPVETLRRMIYAYPTFYRGVSEALAALA